jgi:hypothetical protein
MPPEPNLTDAELSTIASALRALEPARSRIDRDRVMFRAGQAAGRPPSGGGWFWIALAATLAVVAAGEAALLVRWPPPQRVDRLIVARESAASIGPGPQNAMVAARPAGADGSTEASPGLGQTASERLAGQVLRYGLDGLPAAPPSGWAATGAGSVTSRQLLREELQKIVDPGDAS